MITIGPTPEHNCINCAHAHVTADKGPCPMRDFTCRSMLCPSSRGLGTAWKPLGYLLMIGMPLTKTEAATRAAAELKAERQLSPVDLLERRMGTAMTKKEEDKYLRAFETIEEAATSYLQTLDVKATGMVQTIQRARAIDTIRKALSDEIIINIIKPLEGTPLGFMTDRKGDPKGYPPEALRTCLIQAMLHGARIDGNEFNIVKGNAMLVQNYWKRMVAELPGVSHLSIDFGAIEQGQGEASIECLARWRCNGEEMRLTLRDKVKDGGGEWDRRIVVPVNAGMGRDSLLGKAERRVHKMIYERVTGRRIEGMDEDAAIDAEFTEPEAEEPTVSDTVEDPQEVADEQARLREEYVNLLGQAADTERVKAIIKSADEDKVLLGPTLDAIKEAGRQRWDQIAKGK